MIKKINRAEREPDRRGTSLYKLYDRKTLRPGPEIVDHYRKFTRIFRQLGLDYPTWDH